MLMVMMVTTVVVMIMIIIVMVMHRVTMDMQTNMLINILMTMHWKYSILQTCLRGRSTSAGQTAKRSTQA
eukprot:2610041-Karenia_brevis.AAC.1